MGTASLDTASMVTMVMACMTTLQLQVTVGRVTTAPLYVSNGTHLLHLTADGQVEAIVSQGIHRAVGVAVDMRRGFVFWTDIGAGHQGVYRAQLDGAEPQCIVKDVGRVNGLAIDWVSAHVYWTDEERQTIEMSDYSGSRRKILLAKDMKWPRGIVLDPIDGLMYWGDQGTQQIERARLDGSHREVLVSTGLIWPNQLAISYTTRRLYWVDAYNKTIESCELLGDGRRKEHDLLESPYSAPIFGLAVVNETAYISTWYDGAVYSVSLGHPDAHDRLQPEVERLTQREMFSIAVSDMAAQPDGLSPCGQEGRGGCSHICLMTSGSSYRCTCPTYGSLVLGADGRTCVEPEEILLYADKDKGQVGILPLDGSSTEVSDLYILATSVMPVAVTFDPGDHVVYWSDVKERVIYKLRLSDLQKEVFLSEADGIGTVDGLYVDWRNRRLYFCNMGNSSPKSDGAVFTWHRVEFVSLDKTQRRVVVTDVGKPRAITVDAERGFLYYTDWGDKPRVMRTNLDGSEPKEIRSPGSVSNPNGLALHGQWLYLVDSNYNSRVGAPYLAAYDTVTERWTNLGSQQVLIPFGVAARQDQVFYTDWVSTESTTGTIFVYDVTTHVTSELANRMSNPTGLYYSRTSQQLPGGSMCEAGTCGDICVQRQEADPPTCLCAEGTGTTLHRNKDCHKPHSFLLFSDLNTIKMKSLSLDGVPTDPHTYTLYYGYYSANYVALAYNEKTEKIYWSDLYRKQILVGDIRGSPVQVFHTGEHAVDGMALDMDGGHLYWTGYNDYSGVIAMAGITPGGSTYTELLTGLDQPRALVLDLNHRYMYWTEYGRRAGRPRVARAYLDGTHNETIAETRLTWPNALAISGNKLYLADGSHRRIDVFDLDGSNRHELTLMSTNIDHIFGMLVHGSSLYYTDWLTNQTAVVDFMTGVTTTLSSHLYRPGALVLHLATGSQHTTGSGVCNPGHHDCQEICVPVPDGYHCACPLGRKLGKDKKTCVDATTWSATDWFRCSEECHSNAHCARLLSTSIFRCVCREGFHGDGVSECEACPIDTYKESLGNRTCVPCPVSAGTIGWTGSVTCTCDDPDYDFRHGVCTLHVIENGTSENSIPGYGVSPPTFHGCPQGELLQFILQDNSSEVTLNVPITARSWRGREVTVSGSHRLPPGLTFRWTGTGTAAHQVVHYVATDPWGQRATCNFTVEVLDLQVPHFVGCPSDVQVHTGSEYQRVFWEEPVGVDNVGVTELLRPARRSGALFEVGEHLVSYRAKDGQGNIAWCNFTVTVQQIELECPSTPHLLQPLHGGLQCGPGDDLSYHCVTFCDPMNYDLNPDPAYHVLHCHPEGRWLNAFPIDYVTKGCLRKTAMRLVLRKLHFWLYGPCDPASGPALRADIRGAILRLLEADGLCSWTYGAGSGILNMCRNEEIEVRCSRSGRRKRHSHDEPGDNRGDEEVSGNRGRREESDDTEEDGETGDVLIMWTVMETASSDSNVTEAEEKVTSRVSRLQARFDLGVTFTARGATYRSIADKAVVAPLVLECGTGSFNTSNMCLLCPVGTFHSKDSTWCVDCPPGGYQDLEGQESCKQCPTGTYSQPGAFNISQCQGVVAIRPSHPVSRRTLVVTVGSILLGLFTILLFLLCCRHFRRDHRFRGKMCGDKAGAGQENPFVIEIRTDRQGRVAYQEVPDQEKQALPSSSSSTPTPSHSQQCREEEHLLQQKHCGSTPSRGSAPQDKSDLSLPASHKGGAIVRHNRAPPGGCGADQPLIAGDNREEICLEVQSVLQAGCLPEDGGANTNSSTPTSRVAAEHLEDTPVHSSTALLHHHSRDHSPDNH